MEAPQYVRKADFFLRLVLVVFFLAIIVTPEVIFQLCERPGISSMTEKRRLANRPIFSIDSLEIFPKRYEQYYNDNFSFRKCFIQLNSLFTAKTYGISAIPDVLIGKQGWLYYVSKTQGNSLEDYKGLIKIDKRSLELIRENLERRTQSLKLKGIKFVVVVAPDKQSIYPEYLPDNAQRKRRYPTRLDQIIEYLKENTSVQILDVRNILLEEKKAGPLPLYKKTDSHWNYLGGFVAYKEIMRSISFVPKKKNDFEWEHVNKGRGDLANMLALNDQVTEENMIEVKELFESDLTFQNFEKDYGYKKKIQISVAIQNRKNINTQKLLIFHDSFGEGLIKFLCNDFQETVAINTNLFSSSIIEKERPDVVIFQLVERNARSLAWREME
jgi:alginate O-acetyltransferase complex protein AlgJ